MWHCSICIGRRYEAHCLNKGYREVYVILWLIDSYTSGMIILQLFYWQLMLRIPAYRSLFENIFLCIKTLQQFIVCTALFEYRCHILYLACLTRLCGVNFIIHFTKLWVYISGHVVISFVALSSLYLDHCTCGNN